MLIPILGLVLLIGDSLGHLGSGLSSFHLARVAVVGGVDQVVETFTVPLCFWARFDACRGL